MFDNILICPHTGHKLTINAANCIAKVEDSDLSYPIKAGIIDFLPDTSGRISQAYDAFAAAYDEYAELTSLKWRLFSLLAWGFLDDKLLMEKMLSPVPDDFDGVLLDVPAGTGIGTVHKYQKLKKARILALDYSFGMLERAQHRYAEHGIENVTFIRGDVSRLPIDNASIDLCLSSGGFHAFSDKAAALREIVRVLKVNKVFTGSFFIKGKRLLTDLLVWLIFSRKGYFSRPLYSEHECLSTFGEYFTIESTGTMNSVFLFSMNKKNEPAVSVRHL